MTIPSAEEQLILQLINRARSDPSGEMARMFASTNPQIERHIANFNVSEAAAMAQVANLAPVAPVSWDVSLGNSARTHNELMISFGQQSHNLPGEVGLAQRFADGGYDLSRGYSIGENIFAYSFDPLFSHAGFYVDWGYGPDGIQSPPGHRDTMLNGNLTNVGVSYMAASGNIGPNTVTQHFGMSGANPAPFLTGVAIDDADNDDFYDIGEGLGGISVTATGTGGTFSTTTWASGGYTLDIAPGSYEVTFSGSAIGADQSFNINVGSQNVALDVEAVRAAGSTSGDDRILGTEGADTVSGLSGDDFIYVYAGNDSVNGGADNDEIHGVQGNDTLNGGTGRDRIFGGDDQDMINGGDGNDNLQGQNGNDTINGDAGNDRLSGGDGNDSVTGSTGNDTAIGGAGDDTIDGGTGADRIYGDADDDMLIGGAGTDTLDGGAGNDSLDGGGEFDRLYGRNGDDTLKTGDGVGFQIDNIAIGGNGNDSIMGGSGMERLNGEAGNDTLKGGGGDDQLNSGTEDDVVLGDAGNDRLIGDDGNDSLNGGADNDTLFGGEGNDTLNGSSGDDRIDGQNGSDIATGGSGADTFIWAHGAGADGDADVITDLNFVQDMLIIRAFGGNGTAYVDSAAELYMLGFNGLAVQQVGGDTLLTMDQGGSSHTLLLEGITDPFSMVIG